MKQLFSKFLVAFLLTSAVVLSWSEYFYFEAFVTRDFSYMNVIQEKMRMRCSTFLGTIFSENTKMKRHLSHPVWHP